VKSLEMLFMVDFKDLSTDDYEIVPYTLPGDRKVTI
jgi:hypothetical protein